MELGTGLPLMEKNQLQSRRQMKYRRPDEELIIMEEIDYEEEKKGRWNNGEPKAPEVNELHPPVTSFIPQREEDRRWMKMPPPSTMYMQGKTGVSVVRRIPSKKSRQGTEDEISLDKIRIAPRHRNRASSGSDEDADDEDEEDYDSDENFPSKPRAVYRTDANGSHKRTLQRPGLPTLVSVNSIARRDQTNTENVSPRTSAHSHISNGSPMSSNESLPSPRLHAHHHALLLSRSHSSNNQDGMSPRKLLIKTVPAVRIDSQQDRIADLTLDMERDGDELGSDFDEHLAKERIWLGARERPTMGSKRWSTEF
jgi:hypothetical protein